MVVVLLLPVALIILVALVAALVVARSTLSITNEGVEVRNYPHTARTIPIADVRCFEATPRAGNFSSLRPATAALVLTDGSRLPVRKIRAAGAGYGIEALNKRIETLRDDG